MTPVAKFATGINNTSKTGGKICRRWLTPVANLPPVPLLPAAILPPVSLIPVANLRIFEKILNGPNGIYPRVYSGAGGKLIHEKNQKQKIS
jgi:hypothetical protein